MALYQHRFGGQTAAGEQYLFSWWSESGASLDTVQDAAEAWASAFWIGGYDAFVTPGVTLTSVTTGLIDQATGQQLQLAEGTTALSGVATGSALPGDVAIVVSLRTIQANRSGRGRFYLPQPAAVTLTADGRMLIATAEFIVAELLAAWTNYAGTGQPVVYSRTQRAINAVTTFNVGDLFDTQRSRENGLTEARSAANMP